MCALVTSAPYLRMHSVGSTPLCLLFDIFSKETTTGSPVDTILGSWDFDRSTSAGFRY